MTLFHRGVVTGFRNGMPGGAPYIESIWNERRRTISSPRASNIPRILPKDCNAVLKKSSWPRPKIFPFLQKAGPVEEAEMFRVFNMGIGYVLIVAADFADSIGRNLQRWGEKVNRIGTVTAGSGKVVLKN